MDGLAGGFPACWRPGLGSGQGIPVSRLLILSLSLREHLGKLFHVLSFRDVPSAVPAHDNLLGVLGPTKAKP